MVQEEILDTKQNLKSITETETTEDMAIPMKHHKKAPTEAGA